MVGVAAWWGTQWESMSQDCTGLLANQRCQAQIRRNLGC